jgi:6,7-dimethyl-8-ribityllumazine synthase
MALDPNTRVRDRLDRPGRPGARIGIVVSRYHEELTGAMLDSARRELALAGVEEKNHLVVWVPGAFELPLVARALAQRVDVDAVLCLGLILKGETEHDRYVAQGVVHGVVQAGLQTDKPVLFGVLTCSTIEQARSRALPADRGGREDKGREVARAAIETLAALDRVEELE